MIEELREVLKYGYRITIYNKKRDNEVIIKFIKSIPPTFEDSIVREFTIRSEEDSKVKKKDRVKVVDTFLEKTVINCFKNVIEYEEEITREYGEREVKVIVPKSGT